MQKCVPRARALVVILFGTRCSMLAQVSTSGSVVVEKLMEVERYSHVMHISSTVTGKLLPEVGFMRM